MYPILLMIHSFVRYAVLILILSVIVRSFSGWVMKGSYTKLDRQLGSFMLSFAHIQLLLGIILYAVSPMVSFGPETMRNPDFRYWTVEHITMMLMAVTLLTIAVIRVKKINVPVKQHRFMFVLTFLSVLIICTALIFSGRGIL